MIWAVVTEDGGIDRLYRGPDPEAQGGEGRAVIPCPDGVSDDTHWHDGDDFVIRPMIDLPPPHALVGSDWTVAEAPAGTEVWLDGQHLGTTETDDEIVVTFPLPGLWPVELRPPFPWREAGCSVEVSHAD